MALTEKTARLRRELDFAATRNPPREVQRD
jgi:hypothetical protein